MRTLLGLLILAACGTPPPKGPPGATPDAAVQYPVVPSDPQRPGDPAKGYDYLINGGYITCGIPKSAWDQVEGTPPASQLLPGRTGDDANLPYNYSTAMSAEGVEVVTANCLTCHAGHINGQLVVGLGAADGDFTSDQAQYIDLVGSLVSDPTEKAELQRFSDRMHALTGYAQTVTVGTNPADSLTSALMAHRDPGTLAWSATPLITLPPPIVPPVHVPAWWRMAKKNAMFYSSAGRGDHARIEMAASLLCTESVAEATTIDQAFVDVRAWIETMKAPAYPFPVDQTLAAKGQPIFEARCAQCHGTYGATGAYPNVLIPLDTIATDSLLASGTAEFAGPFVQWFASSFWGQVSRLDPQQGYVAPPLDGIWATAPYFHNGSVPTIEAVLDSSKRPRYWTRTFDSTDYDQTAVGWHFTAVDHGQAQETNASTRVKIYDTTLAGYGNGGHGFGDAMTDDERTAVLEYLKTL